MNDSKWILKLYELDKRLHKPAIRKTKSYYICKYTFLTENNEVYWVSIYSKDKFVTVDIIEVFNYKTKKGLFIYIGGKPLSQKLFMLLLKSKMNPKQIINFLSKLKRKKTSESVFFTEDDNSEEEYIWTKKKKSAMDKIADKLSQIMAVVAPLLVLLSLGIFLSSFIRNIVLQKSADRTERNLDELMFKYQTGKEKEFDEYSALINTVQILINTKSINGLLVTGPPGTGKTYVIRRTLYFSKMPYAVLKGTTLDEWSVYSSLYKYRNKLLVLDDFDLPWTENLSALIKAVTDTNKKRIVYFPVAQKSTDTSKSGGLSTSSVPQSFIYTGKLIIITNKNPEEIPAAIRSRMPNFDVRFNIKKMFEILQKMLKFLRNDISMETKQEVLNYLLTLYKKGKLKYLDFRTMEIALDIRIAYPDKWKQVLVSIVR